MHAPNRIDETGTVDIEEQERQAEQVRIARRELYNLRGVSDEVLKVHGTAPGSKPEGITRLVYENVNGLKCQWTNNDKIDKARELHDELEVDIAAYNEHRLNMKHKANGIGFSQLFNGGEAEVRSVGAHNVNENIG